MSDGSLGGCLLEILLLMLVIIVMNLYCGNEDLIQEAFRTQLERMLE